MDLKWGALLYQHCLQWITGLQNLHSPPLDTALSHRPPLVPARIRALDLGCSSNPCAASHCVAIPENRRGAAIE
uniref:Uncharacterized protein n=1 Tax=Arundo donax TaxID=35708 RepID=A0A0A9E321_ARUDO